MGVEEGESSTVLASFRLHPGAAEIDQWRAEDGYELSEIDSPSKRGSLLPQPV